MRILLLFLLFLYSCSTTPKNEVEKSRIAVQEIQSLATLQKTVVDITEVGFLLAQKQREAGNIGELFLTQKSIAWEQAKIDLAQYEAELSLVIGAKEESLQPLPAVESIPQLQPLRDIVDSYAKILLPLQERVSALAMKEYSLMSFSIYELLDTKLSEIAAQMRYEKALAAYWKARADMGGFDAP